MFKIPVVWFRRLGRRQRFYLGGALLIPIVGISALFVAHANESPTTPIDSTSQSPPTEESVTLSTPKKPARPVPAPTPKAQTATPFLFGVGTELDQALSHRITKEAPVKMLTSWYNGPKDLGFMSGWHTGLIPKAHKAGYYQHLIIYSNDIERNISTPYGPACGRPYPVSKQFLADMKKLAQIFRGSTLYVSMFTELQTYPCQDNTWKGSENYYRALQANYRAAMNIFRTNAPGSRISLSWGGWQANWDDPARGGGKALLTYFADVMNASDFQSFQAMANHSNRGLITNMTKALKPYKGGVMVAHYKPDGASQAVFNSDLRAIFTPTNMALLRKNELFAFSFMDTVNMSGSESAYQAVKKIIETYAIKR